MTDLNSVKLLGRLTRDLGSDERSFGYIQNGTARANISIAVNRSKKQGDQWVDEVSYFDVTIWGKAAENLKPYLVKGQQVLIDGILKQERWEKDGQKMSKVAIHAQQVWLVGGKRDDNLQPQSSYAQQYENQQNPFSQSQNNMTQVQQMAGQSFQQRQPQPMPQQQTFDGEPFGEDIPF